MIELLKQQLRPGMPEEEQLNLAREFLQLLCLKIIHDKGYFHRLAFTGGTALRVVFDLKRFSEDVDFSLIEKKGYDFPEFISSLIREYALNGLRVEAKPKERFNVHSAMFKFSGLLKELRLSPLESQNLSLKIEIDTHPPKGGVVVSTYVNKAYAFNVTHFDLPSMFATKLHACFYRKYTKGRDYYDLIWYVGRKIKPNLLLLNNAIEQTQGKPSGITEANFKKHLLENVEKIDFDLIKKDVERFLEDKTELRLFELKAVQGAIAAAYP